MFMELQKSVERINKQFCGSADCTKNPQFCGYGFREQSRCQFGRSSRLGGTFMVSFSRTVEAGSAGARSARTWVFSAGVATRSGQSGGRRVSRGVVPRFVTQPSSVARVPEWSRSRCSFLSVTPSSLTRIEPPLFGVLLQRRLHLPFPLSIRICGCGRPLDSYGHHRETCGRTGVLGRRGPLDGAAALICREGCARVVPNMLMRNMDQDVPVAADAPRIGSGRRWIANVGWGPIGNRHHTGVCFGK